jgi:hypothetical protein
MAQRPTVLVHLIFGLLGVLNVESGLKSSDRDITSEFSATSSRTSRQYSITSFIAL